MVTKRAKSRIGSRGYFVLLVLCVLFLASCEVLQLNIPLQIQTVKQNEAALMIYAENQTSHIIKIEYPISTSYLSRGQYAFVNVSRPGNYKIVATAYSLDRRYQGAYAAIGTVEIPVFLDGNNIVRTRGGFAGYNLVITDGMFVENRTNRHFTMQRVDERQSRSGHLL